MLVPFPGAHESGGNIVRGKAKKCVFVHFSTQVTAAKIDRRFVGQLLQLLQLSGSKRHL